MSELYLTLTCWTLKYYLSPHNNLRELSMEVGREDDKAATSAPYLPINVYFTLNVQCLQDDDNAEPTNQMILKKIDRDDGGHETLVMVMKKGAKMSGGEQDGVLKASYCPNILVFTATKQVEPGDEDEVVITGQNIVIDVDKFSAKDFCYRTILIQFSRRDRARLLKQIMVRAGHLSDNKHCCLMKCKLFRMLEV